MQAANAFASTPINWASFWDCAKNNFPLCEGHPPSVGAALAAIAGRLSRLKPLLRAIRFQEVIVGEIHRLLETGGYRMS
jgi:hypothetical protein